MPPRRGVGGTLLGWWVAGGFVAAVSLQNRPEDASCSSSEPFGFLPGHADLWSDARRCSKGI